MPQKDPEEHRCPMCGNIVGQPQDSLGHNIPKPREYLDVLETVVTLAREVTLLLGETLRMMRETSPGSKCYWCDWVSPNAEELGEHQENKHPEEWAEHWKHHDGEIKELIHWLDEAATGRRRVIGAREWRKQRS